MYFGGSIGKESACKAGVPVQFPGGKDPLEKGMANPCQETPWTEELGGLQSMWLRRVRYS